MKSKILNALLVTIAFISVSYSYSQATGDGRKNKKNEGSASSKPGDSKGGVVKQEDPVLLSIGNSKITLSEFKSVYDKNRGKEDPSKDAKALDNYMDLYVVFKMKVKEAEEMGLDTSAAFKSELGGYRKQLAQPYLTDKEVNDQLLNEAYDRLKYDVHARHILVWLNENALPKDTIEAWNRAMIIRDQLLGKAVPAFLMNEYEQMAKKEIENAKSKKSKDSLELRLTNIKNLGKELAAANANDKFMIAAKTVTDDPSGKTNGGDLGYFTSMKMVYPFECAAYNTKPGDISMPVRTSFGYHLVKVEDKRPARGEVLVAHIMINAKAGLPQQDSINAKNKVDEIYTKLKKGEKFEDLAKQYSDDKASAGKGGELRWFGYYDMPPEIENASFALQNNGDVSEPVKSRFGWHIIKRIDRRGVPKFDDIKGDLKSKISKDRRSSKGKESLIAKLKAEYKFKDIPKAKEEFIPVLDSTFFQAKWSASKASKLTRPVFTLAGHEYTQTDFAKYLESHMTRRARTEPGLVINESYKNWVNETIVNYEETQLDHKYPDFHALMQEYRDGILLFDLMDKKVWTKAVKDTVGLKEFYEKNKNNYLYEERSDASVFTAANQKLAEEAHKLFEKGKPEKEVIAKLNKDSQLNLLVESKIFNKGENKTVDANWTPGLSPVKQADTKFVFVKVNKILMPSPKALADAKGAVTSDYQNYLEKSWVEALRKKYPVSINKDILSQVK
ncbi:MAG: peptidylprolyl isomerase [Bacteroidia bacterium]